MFFYFLELREVSMRGLKIGSLFLAGLTLCVIGLPSFSRAQGTSAAQYYAAGNQLYTARNYAQAAQYYYAATKIDPNYSPAYQGMGNCYYALGRQSDALAFYQRALSLNPSNAQLAQFVQNLQAQLGQVNAIATPSAMQQGAALLKQRQYADSVPFFQQAIQDNPNDYRPYYYAGYASAMLQDNKDAALYFGLAYQKRPNYSIQALAYRYKASLTADDQQWVSDQLAKSSQGEMVVEGSKFEPGFGFDIGGGAYNILSDPTMIVTASKNAGSVSLTGQTPAWSPIISFKPYYQFSENFAVDLNFSYLPAGNLSYTWYNYNGQLYDNYKYTYQISMVNLGLGLKIGFGSPDAMPYLEIGGDISPVSLALDKTQVDSSGNPAPLPETGGLQGNYSTISFGGHATLGVDLKLGHDIALGPYISFQYLDVSGFKDASGNPLVVDQSPAIGGNGGDVANSEGGDPSSPLDLNLSGLSAGVNLSVAF
jgi:tetratricopeptide (TPR) repeat protein